MNAIYTLATSNKNIKVRGRIIDGRVVIETISNSNNPGGCDRARALVEQKLDLRDEIETAKSSHPLEEKITTPALEQIEEVKQIQQQKF